MAQLRWRTQSQRYPASPSMGRLPDDPYYKLRYQAELNALDQTTSPRLSTASIRLPEGTGGTWRADSVRTIASGVVEAPADPAPPLAVNPACDSVVSAEQIENEEWLRVVSQQALTEFKLAREGLGRAADLCGYEQHGVLAQTLESLRRGMNKLADAIYPPRSGAVVDRLGKDAPTHERAYKARISLALQEATDSDGRFRLAERELNLHHQRLTQLVERIAQGVHGEADYGEARQLYVGAWQIIAHCRLYLPLQSL